MESPDTLLRVHGGQVDVAEALYRLAPRPFLDLSTGINPQGYPLPQIDPALWQRLPLKRELDGLRDSAWAFYGAPAGTDLAVVPGTELAIRLLPHLLKAGRVGILGPTYGSHASAWDAAGATVVPLGALSAMPPMLDAIVVVNPNNPDGQRLAPELLLTCARQLSKSAGFLIVDEAFAEVTPELSLLGLPQLPANVVVLRSLGKFFGLAGVRAGFVAAGPDIIRRLNDLLGDWPIGGPAALVATLALRDSAWIATTKGRLAADRARLDRLLEKHGLAHLGGTDLFRLVRGPTGLDSHLGRQGILVRGFDIMPGCFRFGLPGTNAEFSRLADALQAALGAAAGA